MGLVLPEYLAGSPQGPWDADEEFVNRLIRELDLSPDQAKKMRVIVAWRQQEEIRSITEHAFDDLPEEMQTSLNAARTMADRRIEHILDDKQRERYRELIAGMDRQNGDE